MAFGSPVPKARYDSMHIEILLPVVEELASLLEGARVDRVIQGKEDRGLYLFLRRNRENRILLISPQRSLPRLHLVSRKPQSSNDPHPLVLMLRSRLVGTRVAHVAVLNQDRVVEMQFSGDARSYFLIFELTGSSSNIFFIDGDRRIISSYHAVSASEHSRRLLLPGSLYVPPQKRESSAVSRRALPEALSSSNKSAEEFYEHFIEQEEFSSLRAQIHSALKKAIARTERRYAALRKDLAAVQEAEDFRKKGDLILANLQHLKNGMESAELVRFDGAHAVVQLDPKRTPSQNAELYFKKYKKARNGYPLVRDRLGRTEEELSVLRSQEREVEKAADVHALLAVKGALERCGYADQRKEGRRLQVPKTIPGVRKIVFQGWEIIIGKSAAGNDYLTQSIARPDDLWLHAEGLPGSHVLVRNPRKSDIPQEILLHAASLAARHSKGRQSGKVPVTYTLARYVSKPKGAKPGLVVLSERKTIMVRPADDVTM